MGRRGWRSTSRGMVVRPLETYGDTDEWCREIYSNKRLTLKLGAVKVPEDFLGVYL